MKKVFTLLAVLLTSLVLVACNTGSNEGYLVVGMEADYMPFNWYETSPNDYNHPLEGSSGGYVAGYDVDMAKYIANELGLELKIKAIEWLSLVSALQTNEIDIIIAGMSPTAERREVIEFTNSYYISNHVVVVLADGEYSNVTELSDLEGSRGVGQLGTIYADLVDYVRDNYNSTSLPVVDSVTLATNAILEDLADFTIVEKPVALGMIATYPNLAIVLDVEENIFEVSDEDRELAIGLRKTDTELAELLNDALATVTNEMVTTWMNLAVSRSSDNN